MMPSMSSPLRPLQEGEQDSYTRCCDHPEDFINCDECFEHIYDDDRAYRKMRGGVIYTFCSRECREVVS